MVTVLFYFDKHIKDGSLYSQSQFFLPKAYHDKKNKADLWKKGNSSPLSADP